MKPNDNPPEPTAAEDLDILFPDVELEVRDPDSGEAVPLTVREFRFLEGLRVSARIQPLVEAIAASVRDADDREDAAAAPDVEVGAVTEAMTEHAGIWIDCIAQATGRDAAWIGRLSDADGQALSAAMWSANGRFFGRRLVEAVRRRRQAGPSPSPPSSMPSCGPDTGADTATSPSG